MTRAEINTIKMALIKIHCKAEYHEGMEMICKLVNWGGLIKPNPHYSKDEQFKVKARFNAWVRRQSKKG